MWMQVYEVLVDVVRALTLLAPLDRSGKQPQRRRHQTKR